MQRLADLVTAGWRFEHRLDDEGHVRQVNGARVTGHYIDGIRVRGRSEVAGIRWDLSEDGREAWRREGTLVEVIDALLALPEPS